MIRRIAILTLTLMLALGAGALSPVEHGNHQTAAQPSKPPKPHTPPKPNKPTKPSYSGPTFTPTGSYGGHDYVDLGLPSGTLWATTNVGADKPEDYGSYFAWGETSPKSSYDWSNYKWCRGTDNTLTKYCYDSHFGNNDERFLLELSDDAAYVNWGLGWRIPSWEQIDELETECNWKVTKLNGVNGQLVTSKHNGKNIFLPAAGFIEMDTIYAEGESGAYISNNVIAENPIAIDVIGFYLNKDDRSHLCERYLGVSVRAVRYKENPTSAELVTPSTASDTSPTGSHCGHDYVDLGLPSGTLWATMNVGANKPEDYGSYFAWGETSPKSSYDWSNYKWCKGSDETLTKYCTSEIFGTIDDKRELESKDDVATVNWGLGWRIPSKEQLDELKVNCTWTWATLNGVNGYVVSRNGKSIFLPSAGSRYGGTTYDANSSFGFYYWSRTLCEEDYFSQVLKSSNSYCIKNNNVDEEYKDDEEKVYLSGRVRNIGLSVRAVRDNQ